MYDYDRLCPTDDLLGTAEVYFSEEIIETDPKTGGQKVSWGVVWRQGTVLAAFALLQVMSSTQMSSVHLQSKAPLRPDALQLDILCNSHFIAECEVFTFYQLRSHHSGTPASDEQGLYLQAPLCAIQQYSNTARRS